MSAQHSVSQAQVAVYIEHGGNSDMYWHRQINDPRMFDAAWGTIDDLVQRLTLVAKQPTTAAYRDDLERDLIACTTDEQTRALIRKIAAVGVQGVKR
jgi:hypothetical protein